MDGSRGGPAGRHRARAVRWRVHVPESRPAPGSSGVPAHRHRAAGHRPLEPPREGRLLPHRAVASPGGRARFVERRTVAGARPLAGRGDGIPARARQTRSRVRHLVDRRRAHRSRDDADIPQRDALSAVGQAARRDQARAQQGPRHAARCVGRPIVGHGRHRAGLHAGRGARLRRDAQDVPRDVARPRARKPGPPAGRHRLPGHADGGHRTPRWRRAATRGRAHDSLHPVVRGGQ